MRYHVLLFITAALLALPAVAQSSGTETPAHCYFIAYDVLEYPPRPGDSRNEIVLYYAFDVATGSDCEAEGLRIGTRFRDAVIASVADRPVLRSMEELKYAVVPMTQEEARAKCQELRIWSDEYTGVMRDRGHSWRRISSADLLRVERPLWMLTCFE